MRGQIELPLTIERQLERYARAEGHTQRHEVLWHTWHQNKRWITQLLEGTAMSFPNYSRHDESHAQAVLHNIELILGEDRIDQLSATDCFVLLHTVYIHDIGMTITSSERSQIVSNDKFIDMLNELEMDGAPDLRSAVAILKRTDYGVVEKWDIEAQRSLYLAKLEVYNAIIQLISNYRRSEHGERTRDYLYDWTKKPEKLGTGFSLAGMPQRIFLTIAECARMHTTPYFDNLFELAQEDDGYVFDYMHPRFISILLMLGDILDIDNDRFHPLAISDMDDAPTLSQLHYKKHLAIRRLHIRPDIIEIKADCETQDALRLIRSECDMLINILSQAGYKWTSIRPAGFPGSLPSVQEVQLKLSGKDIPKDLVTMRFNISQKKAFEILEGANLYKNRFAFLREFLQNALDATKRQYWKECISMSNFYNQGGLRKIMSPYDLEQYVSTSSFPIEIEMEICKRNEVYQISTLTRTDLEELDRKGRLQETVGVKVRIKDFGVGIGQESLRKISEVGTSMEKEKREIKEMPQWLRPTGRFGVGLQSAFLVTKIFKCRTHTRTEERYDITFGSGALSEYKGYINVEPLDKDDSGLEEDTYGTGFEVFVSEDKKMLHEEFPESWDGADMFTEKYEKRRQLRHAAELMSQMVLYLDGLLGEASIFPIELSLKKPSGIEIPIDRTSQNKLHAIKLRNNED